MNKISFFLILSLVVFSLCQFDSDYRIWYVGGNFSTLYNGDTAIAANNIAAYEHDSYYALGSGTNGPVKHVYTDLCKNIYVTGAFTQAGNVTTGPAAVFYWQTNTWNAIGSASITWSPGAVVNDVSVDCFNVPTGLSCPCDVYLAGRFNATFGTTIATNIIRYVASSNSWDNMGGVAAHGINLYANAIYKKGILTGLHGTTPQNYVYVVGQSSGGSIFNRYNTAASPPSWGFGASIGTLTGSFYWFSYASMYTESDMIFLGGNYTWTQGSTSCTNACGMTYDSLTMSTTGGGPTGAPATIRAIAYIEDIVSTSTPTWLFIGGTFSGYALVDTWPFTTNAYSPIVAGAYFNASIVDIDTITNSNPISDSLTGSANLVASDGSATYYSRRYGTLTPFPGNPYGTFRSVATAYNPLASSGSALSFTNSLILFIIAFASMMMLSF